MNHGIRKAVWFLVCVLSVLAVAGTSWAGPIVINGNFESGNTGFTSGYIYTNAADGLFTSGGALQGAGYYAVGTNPQYFHTFFYSFGDHTTGTGNMMIVNGSETPNTNVWTGTMTGLVIGQTYEFSAWVANVYPVSPATLDFSYDGTPLGSFSATSVAVWQPFTALFTATANNSASAVDINLEASGNDFALDDISVTAVGPLIVSEPSLIFLLGLGIGAVSLFVWRMKA